MASTPQSDELSFVAHDPERRRRGTILVAAGCCCCCCCCLHSVGSLAGALYGGFKGQPPTTLGLPVEEALRERGEQLAASRYANKTYWLSLLIIAIITTFVAVFESRGESFNNTAGITALVIALGLPFGQLGASVLALIYINVFPPARKPESLRRLGRITLFSFLWGLVGTGAMAAMFPFFK